LETEKLDVKGKMCPMPVAFTKRKLETMSSGQLLEVVGEGELEFDNVQRWVRNNGHEVVEASKSGAEFRVLIKKHQ
jgi:tRNA 2-thiouridine synthesizing protein A